MERPVEPEQLPIGPDLDSAVARVLGYTEVEIEQGIQLPIGPSERVQAGSVEILYTQGLPGFSTDPGAQDEMLEWLGHQRTPSGQVQLCWYVELKKWAARFGREDRHHSNWTVASGATINEALSRLVLAVAGR
jgi:hypothetical protein